MPRGLRLDLTFHAKAFALDDHRVGVMQGSVANFAEEVVKRQLSLSVGGSGGQGVE
jgi:hypothetical protein